MLVNSFVVKLSCLLGFAAVAAGAIGSGPPSSVAVPKKQHVSVDSKSLAKARAHMLMADQKFIKNAGQWDSRAMYAGRSPGLDVWLEKRGLDFDYYTLQGLGDKRRRVGQAVRLDFLGASPTFNYVGHNAYGDHIDFLNQKNPVRGATSFADVRARWASIRASICGPISTRDTLATIFW